MQSVMKKTILSRIDFMQNISKPWQDVLFFYDLLNFLKENNDESYKSYLCFWNKCNKFLFENGMTPDMIPRIFDNNSFTKLSHKPENGKMGWMTAWMQLSSKINLEDLKNLSPDSDIIVNHYKNKNIEYVRVKEVFTE